MTARFTNQLLMHFFYSLCVRVWSSLLSQIPIHRLGVWLLGDVKGWLAGWGPFIFFPSKGEIEERGGGGNAAFLQFR